MNAAPAYSIPFTRTAALAHLEEVSHWDLIIIGGGATGLGVAVDAATRGLKVLLLEGSDFAKGTSSRSTKLVHGGVRYLAQGDIGLVFEALRERGFLLKNAAHLVRKQAFVIPCYSQFARFKYWNGLKLYDWLSVHLSFGSSKWLSSTEVAAQLPGVRYEGLVGGVLYYDGQFDDARLAINLAQTAAEQGATLLNYFKAESLIKESGKITGIVAKDVETEKEYQLKAKVVVNATGVFVDALLQMDQPEAPKMVRPSQGIHLVLDRSFLPGNAALMIPETTDGRVLFALPWYDRLLVGTTDTPLTTHSQEPVALEEEVDFVLQNVRKYLTRTPGIEDVQSIFAGLRPLAAPQTGKGATKEISRSHKLMVAPSGLVTITGGKWTTYRKMAEDVVNMVEKVGGFEPVRSGTKELNIHGCTREAIDGHRAFFGSDAPLVQALEKENPAWTQPLVQGHPFTGAEVIWAVRHEMARTVEDVLARRLRLLFLDAKAAHAAAPKVALLMASALGNNPAWIKEQLKAFDRLAQQYLPRNHQVLERVAE